MANPSLVKTEDALELDLSPCRGSEFKDALAKIKDIPGRRFDGSRKVWCLPLDATTAERVVQSVEPQAAPEIHEWIKQAKIKETSELTTQLADDAALNLDWAGPVGFVPDLTSRESEVEPLSGDGAKALIRGQGGAKGLFPHQRAAVDVMASHGAAILADDMGLGKTTEMVATVEEWALRNGQPDGPRLIVSPNSVKGVWARELCGWLGDDLPHQIVDGSSALARHNQLESAIAEDAWVIVNYEQLRVKKEKKKLRNGGEKIVTVMKEPLFEKTEWLAVLADEAHRIKNRKAAQTRGIYKTRGKVMIAATGTPIMNSPDDLWSLLHWLFPQEYTSYWKFFEMYVDYYETRFGREITGVRNPDALRFELSGRLIRRTKREILDLPGKIREIVPVELTPEAKKAYKEAEAALWLDLEKELLAAIGEGEQAPDEGQLVEIANGAVRTTRLRQVSEAAKLATAREIILDAQPKQMSVFVEFTDNAKKLVEMLREKKVRAEYIIGEVTPAERTELIERFQAGLIDVLVGTDAMGEGVTLHNADTSIHVSRSWSVAKNMQREDRHDRIGQENKVTILILEAVGTIDREKVAPSNRLKSRIMGVVVKQDHIEEKHG